MDDHELARRSVRSFGEILAVVGRDGIGPQAEVRRPDAVGARIASFAGNPWLDAVVVPADAVAPADKPGLSSFVWTLATVVQGRVESPSLAMPCMGLDLVSAEVPDRSPDTGTVALVSPSPAEVGAANDRAYGPPPVFGPLAARIDDERVRTHGLTVDGDLACVAMTLALGDDLGIHYVATEADHRRRGLATRLLDEVLAQAAADGFRTATLQASPDGHPVYRRMGFREVGRVHAFMRP